MSINYPFCSNFVKHLLWKKLIATCNPKSSFHLLRLSLFARDGIRTTLIDTRIWIHIALFKRSISFLPPHVQDSPPQEQYIVMSNVMINAMCSWRIIDEDELLSLIHVKNSQIILFFVTLSKSAKSFLFFCQKGESFPLIFWNIPINAAAKLHIRFKIFNNIFEILCNLSSYLYISKRIINQSFVEFCWKRHWSHKQTKKKIYRFIDHFSSTQGWGCSEPSSWSLELHPTTFILTWI